MENQLSPTEQKLFSIMRYAPIGLSEINEDGDVISLNLKGEELLSPLVASHGFTLNNIFPVLDFISPGATKRVKAFNQPGGVIIINELHAFYLAPGDEESKKYFNLTITKMYPGCMMVSFEDFTEKHRKENAMRMAEVDKAVEQGKFEIASGVLHDIGNAIVGFGSHLTRMRRLQEQDNVENLANLAAFLANQQQAIAGAIGEQKAAALTMMINGIVKAQRNNHDEIRKSISEQLTIISHIQEILNIQRQYVSGRETQERKPVNIRSILNDCMAMLFASFDKRGIEITMQVPNDLPIIKGDRTKLMQVILNLLKNALEAIDIGAQEKYITVQAMVADGKLLLQVKDNGMGFDEETGQKLFSRGFTTKSSGSGIGLDNCKKILETHGATLTVESEGPGKGCVSAIEFKL